MKNQFHTPDSNIMNSIDVFFLNSYLIFLKHFNLTQSPFSHVHFVLPSYAAPKKNQQTNKQTKQQRKMETNRRTIISQTNVPTACDWLSGRVKKKCGLFDAPLAKVSPIFPNKNAPTRTQYFTSMEMICLNFTRG